MQEAASTVLKNTSAVEIQKIDIGGAPTAEHQVNLRT